MPPQHAASAGPAGDPEDPPAGPPADAVKAAGTWKQMVDSNQALLLRKTGHDVNWWVDRCREAGVRNDAELRDWMRDRHGITGYAQYAVTWEMFGYPDFLLRDAGELSSRFSP